LCDGETKQVYNKKKGDGDKEDLGMEEARATTLDSPSETGS
jgi:hypothetical protein